jgi:tyrosyl-tRNA synthetase
MNNVVQILKDRGLFDDATSPEIEKLVESPVTVYAGFDPSDVNLQLGNLVTVMVLSHFWRCGHTVIAVVGGATGMIGDPSGKTSERQLLTAEDITRNEQGIKENLSRFIDFDATDGRAKLLNNADWLGQMPFVDFLRDVGKHFRMGSMLGKESVRSRLDSETGMSFTEFSYQLLQAYDFLKLYDEEGCQMQVGGSDQWGNITAGIDFVRKQRNAEAYGLTFPLVCDSNGQKFGKSEGNAVSLGAEQTSVYEFYQFLVRSADEDVINLLKIFTFLELDEIADLEKEVKEHPESRAAQKKLAEELTRMVHGDEGLASAQAASGVLFGASMEGLASGDLLEIFSDVPSCELPMDEVEGSDLPTLAVAAKACSSKSEARRLIQNGGLYMNNGRVKDLESVVSRGDVIDDRLLVLRSGKKNFYLVRVV